MLGQRRRPLLLLALCAACTLLACQGLDSPRLGADVRRSLERGRAYADALAAADRDGSVLESEAVVALGYLERLRLGLGSPFRLAEFAGNDPRLSDSTRARLGWAILARTLDGAAYQLDPALLNRAAGRFVGSPTVGRRHLELIQDAIEEARDPRAGEMAVRLAYRLAAAEGTVTARTPGIAAQIAALLHDRELARADALALLRAAEAEHVDARALLPAWRAARRFRVEQPTLAPLPLEIEREALRLSFLLAERVRKLAARFAAGLEPELPPPGLVPLLGAGAAARLAALADSLDAPPQTPVVVAVDVQRRELLDRPGLSREAMRVRERFVERASNEERFAAEFALLLHDAEPRAAAPARTALAAAVALRGYAQEKVWFPGFPGPSARELEERFGLASVTFERDVPASWRPYYRRMLEQSLADLQRVLPALDLRGLRVRFGAGRGRGATLALHNPRTRTLVLPPRTSAGTIAHEVAHDLDWQVALRRYHVRGDYATDRATRSRPRDRFAVWLLGLTTAALLPPAPGSDAPPAHAHRPAEVFARSIDWFVAVSLAREGRTNGYLSSVQDDMLTGYGTVTPPDITGTAGKALVNILDEVAPLYADTRQWFLQVYGPDRALTPYDLLRRVLEAPNAAPRAAFGFGDGGADGEPLAPLGSPVEPGFAALEGTRESAFAAIDAWLCRAPAAAYDPMLELLRRRLVGEAAGASARGLALDFADQLAGEAGRAWVARRFFGAPWPAADVDSTSMPLLAALVDEAERFSTGPVAAAAGGFDLPRAPARCGDALLSAR